MTVKKQADIDNPTVLTGYLVDGKMSVPLADGNRHYKMVQEWIAEGNTPEDAYTVQELHAYTNRVEVQEALTYLKDTDWQVMREHDTGKLMDTDVKTKRNDARVIADGNQKRITT